MTLNVYEAFGTLVDALTDSDGCDSMHPNDTSSERAEKFEERARHLKDVLNAMLDYAELVLDDTYAHNFGTAKRLRLSAAREQVDSMFNIMVTDAEAIDPGRVVAPALSVTEIEGLVKGHLAELAGKTHQDLAQWARGKGVRPLAMSVFWRVFTIELFKRGKPFHEMKPPILNIK